MSGAESAMRESPGAGATTPPPRLSGGERGVTPPRSPIAPRSPGPRLNRTELLMPHGPQDSATLAAALRAPDAPASMGRMRERRRVP